LDHAKNSNSSHYHSYCSAVKVLLQLYSGFTVDSFTPKCLVAVQHCFAQQVDKHGKRYSRQYCNDLVKRIRQMFRWGVAQELVAFGTAGALKFVPPLRKGQTQAPESKPRKDVPDMHRRWGGILKSADTAEQPGNNQDLRIAYEFPTVQ
jgi:hypothetical protein